MAEIKGNQEYIAWFVEKKCKGIYWEIKFTTRKFDFSNLSLWIIYLYSRQVQNNIPDNLQEKKYIFLLTTTLTISVF